MRVRLAGLVGLVALLAVSSVSLAEEKYDGEYGKGPHRFSLATGSPGELGLLKALGDAFSLKAETTLLWKKSGLRRITQGPQGQGRRCGHGPRPGGREKGGGGRLGH